MQDQGRLLELLNLGSETDWCNHLFSLARGMGFSQLLFAVVPSRQNSLETAFLRSNYSEHWRRAYDAQKMLHHDPTVTHCVIHTTPLIWAPSIFRTTLQKQVYEEACSFGIRSGVTLPMHGPRGELGILCFVDDAHPGRAFQRELSHRLPALALIRDYALESSRRFFAPDQPQPESVPSLTRRELECLKWIMVGKTSWETGQILRCSEAAVNFHLNNVRQKFGVSSRSQAVVKAIRLGLLILD